MPSRNNLSQTYLSYFAKTDEGREERGGEKGKKKGRSEPASFSVSSYYSLWIKAISGEEKRKREKMEMNQRKNRSKTNLSVLDGFDPVYVSETKRGREEGGKSQRTRRSFHSYKRIPPTLKYEWKYRPGGGKGGKRGGGDFEVGFPPRILIQYLSFRKLGKKKGKKGRGKKGDEGIRSQTGGNEDFSVFASLHIFDGSATQGGKEKGKGRKKKGGKVGGEDEVMLCHSNIVIRPSDTSQMNCTVSIVLATTRKGGEKGERKGGGGREGSKP